MSTQSFNLALSDYEDESNDQNQPMETSSKGQVKGSVSGTYFTSGANFSFMCFIFILFILAQVLASGADYWVSFW